MVWSSRLKDSLAPLAAAGTAAGAIVTDGSLEGLLMGTAVAAGGVSVLRARRERDAAVGRLAAVEAKARETAVVAETAGALLAAPVPAAAVAPRLERALAELGARLQICHAPAPRLGEIALPLRAGDDLGWFYIEREGPLSRREAERLLERIGELVTVAEERTRVDATAAEAEARRQADLAKTAVMHAISHDLRVPLGGLNELARELAEAPPSDADRAQVTQALTRETAALERMVEDLLDLSKIEAGATNPQPDWCDLAEIVAAAADRVRSQRGDFAVHLGLPPDLPLVRADRGQLERVFTNLLENAAKFSPSDRTVEVRGICANGRVTIRVIDHGGGIPPQQQSQVFRAFVRGSSSESGSGLGLAICRGFVEANGGRITLQSGARDGSAFAVSFPTAPQPAPIA